MAVKLILGNYGYCRMTVEKEIDGGHTLRNGGVDDFEDAVAASSALSEKCEAIVTRNIAHFAASQVPPVAPSAFLRDME